MSRGKLKNVRITAWRIYLVKNHNECVDNKNRAMFDSYYINRIESSGFPSHNFFKKRNAVIVLIINLNII